MKYCIFILVACVFLAYLSCDTNTGRKQIIQTEKKVSVSDTQANNAQKISRTKGVLKISRSRINIGEVKKGDDVTHNFILKNIGTEEVSIIDYQTSCNCTGIDVSKNTISPSDSVAITMTIDTKEKSIGGHNIHAILTTDGQRKYYNLELSFILVN